MLASISTFFRNILRSCYDMEFYRQVRVAPARRSFGYLAALTALFVAIGTAQLAPAAVRARDGLAEALRTRLPDGTIVAMQDGRLETNLPAPFDTGLGDPRAIIDVTVEGTEPRDLPAGTLLVGRDAVFFADASGETQAAPYEGIPPFSLTKEQAVARVTSVPTEAIVGIVLLLAIPWYLLFLLGLTISAAIAAGAVWTVGLALKKGTRLRYAQWFAVACRAMTLPLVATALFGPWIARIPFARSLLLYMIMAAAFLDERSRPTGPDVHATHEPAPSVSAKPVGPKPPEPSSEKPPGQDPHVDPPKDAP